MKEFVWKNIGNNSEPCGIFSVFCNHQQSMTAWSLVFVRPLIVLHGLVQSELWMITRGLLTWTQNLKGSNNAGQWLITPKQCRVGIWFWRESLFAIASALDYVLGIVYWIIRLDWLCIPLAAKPYMGFFEVSKRMKSYSKIQHPRSLTPKKLLPLYKSMLNPWIHELRYNIKPWTIWWVTSK